LSKSAVADFDPSFAPKSGKPDFHAVCLPYNTAAVRLTATIALRFAGGIMQENLHAPHFLAKIRNAQSIQSAAAA
jgi:hypothetical protein